MGHGRSRYSGAVSAAHLGKPGNSLLIALIAVVVVPLAGIGFIIYLGLKHRSGVLILWARSTALSSFRPRTERY